MSTNEQNRIRLNAVIGACEHADKRFAQAEAEMREARTVHSFATKQRDEFVAEMLGLVLTSGYADTKGSIVQIKKRDGKMQRGKLDSFDRYIGLSLAPAGTVVATVSAGNGRHEGLYIIPSTVTPERIALARAALRLNFN